MEQKQKTKKRVFIEWAALLGFVVVLYGTGLNKKVGAVVQGLVLKTGFMDAKAGVQDDEEPVMASYNFNLTSLDGQKLDFKSLKGKTVFMNFWATWCPPCMAEMPDIHELYKDFASDDIVFVMVSLDEKPAKVRRYLQKKEYDFDVHFVTEPMPPVYEHSAIPTTFVLSPKGEIVLQVKGMANYNNDEFRKFLTDLSKE